MTRPTKFIIAAAVIAIVIGIITFALSQLTSQGTLNVSAGDKTAIIGVTRIDPKPEIINTKNARGNFSAKLPVGTYTVTVTSGLSSIQQVATVKGGQTTSVALDIPKPLDTEVVASVPASDVFATNSTLRYLNRDTTLLTEINASNQINTIGPLLHFSAVSWADATFGVARDINGNLYTITDQTPSRLSLPFSPSPTSSTFAVAPDKDFYVTDGSKVYRGAPGQPLVQVFKSNKSAVIRSASNAGVLIQEGDPQNMKSENELIAINTGGDVSRTEGEAYDATWSPTGDKVVINGDELTAVLDAKLNLLARLPQNNVTKVVWLNNTTVIYSVQNKLWQFNTETSQASVLATTDGATISQQFATVDGSAIYLITQNSKDGKNPAIQRVSLGGHTISKPAAILSRILPNTLAPCQLSLVNFTGLAVAVQGPKGSEADCMQKAQKYLQTYHVSTAGLGISFSSL